METNDFNDNENDETVNNSLSKVVLPEYMLTEKGDYTCNLHFDNYFDLFVVIEDLIEISLHTLYNSESENSGFVRHPTRHLVSVLELVKKLLPGDTGQTLTELNDYLNTKRESDSSKQNNELQKKNNYGNR